MLVTFHGATREVTGSMHLLTMNGDRVLLDCGMFQGRRKESDRKNRVMPFDPGIITNMILSHAHIDHSGRIPILTRDGFAGQVICTRATANACTYMLPDSAHIQESDANYLNYKRVRALMVELRTGDQQKNNNGEALKEIRKILKRDKDGFNTEAINDVMARYRVEAVEPLYTKDDAQYALTAFYGVPYRSPVAVGQDMECVLYDAGHILGSAITIVKAKANGRTYTVGYSGDIGRFDKSIINDPTLDFDEADRNIDLLIMESTYGDRDHDPVADMMPRLKKIITETVERGGTILIPSFAFGRTQELLYAIHMLYKNEEVPQVPVYVDSPLASNMTRVFAEHPEMYDTKTHNDFLEEGKNPFVFKEVTFTRSVAESMALMREKKPHIVISASGMCEGGRILHHLRYKIHDARNTILIVGFMARHTLGRRLLEEGEAYENAGRTGNPPLLRVFDKEYPLRARVISIGGFSAHGDRNEMLRFVEKSNLNIRQIALVHGEDEALTAFSRQLADKGHNVVVPRAGESVRVGG
jgi:metallo-beta-lactamase family protein